jgi:uncharacterized protein (AIM24 family)
MNINEMVATSKRRRVDKSHARHKSKSRKTVDGGGFFGFGSKKSNDTQTAPPPESVDLKHELMHDGLHVKVTLEPNQRLLARNGAMIWYDSGLDVKIRFGKVTNALGRLVSGNDLLMTEFRHPLKSSGIKQVALGSSWPMAKILTVQIPPGKTLVAQDACFVACTSNVEVSGNFNIRGAVTGNGIFLSKLSVPQNAQTGGTVWLAGFGGIETLEIADGEEKRLDTGFFLAAWKEDTDRWELGLAGSVVGSVFNGEGIVLKVKGPCKLHVSSHSIRELVNGLLPYFPQSSSGSSISAWGSLFEALADQ